MGLENEAMRKSDAMKALSKAQAEIQLWKSRYETEGMGRIEELEGARAKLQAKIVENEELVDVLQTKGANAEKSKGRLGSDLADKIKDLLDQLGEGGRSIHDLDKQCRRLEQEKEELQAALEEAEATLEMEENKVLRAQLELGQVKQEIDRRVAEKED